MLIEIDFSSDEAIYQQLCNQIILGIATSRLTDGDVLPSVRQMADEITGSARFGLWKRICASSSQKPDAAGSRRAIY